MNEFLLHVNIRLPHATIAQTQKKKLKYVLRIEIIFTLSQLKANPKKHFVVIVLHATPSPKNPKKMHLFICDQSAQANITLRKPKKNLINLF
jgi:hypothetical protein